MWWILGPVLGFLVLWLSSYAEWRYRMRSDRYLSGIARAGICVIATLPLLMIHPAFLAAFLALPWAYAGCYRMHSKHARHASHVAASRGGAGDAPGAMADDADAFFQRLGVLDLELVDGAPGRLHLWRVVLMRQGLFARRREGRSLSRLEEIALEWRAIRRIDLFGPPHPSIRVRHSWGTVRLRLDGGSPHQIRAFQEATYGIDMAAMHAFDVAYGADALTYAWGAWGKSIINPGAQRDRRSAAPSVADAFAYATRWRKQAGVLESARVEIPALPLDEELEREIEAIREWERA